jgi:ribokinase
MDSLPRKGEEKPVREIQRVSGGTAANVSVAAARILGPRRVAFIGALGQDSIAKEQINILRNEAVESSGILIVPDEESGQAFISISADGSNEIHTYFGANLKITGDHLNDSERIKLIKQSRVCVIMDPPIKTAEEMAKLCKKYGSIVIWDPGVYAEKGLDALLPTLMRTDYFILNHLEYENLLGTSDSREVIQKLGDKVKGIKAIIKRGSLGCTLCNEGSDSMIQMNAVPLKKLGMEVINTVGCGDAFIGGFASAKVEGLPDEEALKWAIASGSFKATKKETRGGPTFDELKEFIKLWLNQT